MFGPRLVGGRELFVGVEADHEATAFAASIQDAPRAERLAQLGLEVRFFGRLRFGLARRPPLTDQAADKGFRLANIESARFDHTQCGGLRLTSWQAEQRTCMAFADPPIGERLSRRAAELEQSERIADRRTRLADFCGNFFVRQFEIISELAVPFGSL